jgi:Mg2+/Co2+ transporter CorB
MMAALLELGFILVPLLAVSALFSAAETALTGASRGRMHQLEKEGDRAARRVNLLLADQETMIGSVLLGNNLINILATALTTRVIAEVFPGDVGVVIATGMMTVLVLVFAEVLPKTLAIVKSDDVARFLSGPTLLVVRVAGPIIYGIQYVLRMCLKVFGINLSMETDVLAAHEEIRGAVEYHHAEGVVESDDRRMLGGVLDLSEMDVSEIMVHRRQIEMIDIELTPKEVVAQVLASSHSRLPLYKDEPENIVGVLHAKDLLTAIATADGKIAKLDIAAIARAPWFIPETTNLRTSWPPS